MRLFQIATLLLLIQFASLPLAGKDFAPCAPRSETAVRMAETTGWDSCKGIPSAERVGIPAPRGAQVVSATNGGMDLPGITLLSPAPANEVIDFYRRSLTQTDGWNWNGLMNIFYRGNSVADALFLKTPSVRIVSVSDPSAESFLVSQEFRQKARTRIEIHYKAVQTPGAQASTKG